MEQNFDLEATLQSGQIFRWEIMEDGAQIWHGDKTFRVDKNGMSNDVAQEWLDQFLRTDQPTLKHDHPYVAQAIKSTKGIRVLRQEPWECLVTFIISQNNHQKRIQANCKALATQFGTPLKNGGNAFPKPHQLGSEQELRDLKFGYRSAHIAELKNISLAWLYSLRTRSYEDAHKELLTLKGVGPKVADCILLFSMDFVEACPEDVWIKRIFTEHQLTREDLGPNAGLIQQALFHHARQRE